MALQNRRVVAGIGAVGVGALSPSLAEEVLAHRLGLEGMPVLYGILGVSAIGSVAAAWYSSKYSWKSLLLYGVLAIGGAFVAFVSLFNQTQA